jgi:tetratricopeptide (TPR) repeat protein
MTVKDGTIGTSFRIALAVIVTVTSQLAGPRGAGAAELGHIDFPVTGSGTARRHFVRGMLAMHSFWYEEARDEFQQATRADPRCAMGYWGEALTYYHPVWDQENLVGSRAAIAKIPVEGKLTTREQELIAAARGLFGDGTLPARWNAYADALRALHRRFADDDEVATLCALAVLGNGLHERYGDAKQTSFKAFAESAAIALEVLRHNPRHPGAAHYVIHAFDDPDHAILALPAARAYAKIAPEAPHALHMPSHIFVQLGMWPEAAASNDAAWAASLAWTRAKHLDASFQDFHSLSWSLSIALESGQRHRANDVLALGRDDLAHSHDPDHMPLSVGRMGAEYILKTGEWQRMDDLLAPLTTVRGTISGSATQQAMPGCAGHVESNAARGGLVADGWLAFMRAEAAAARNDATTLRRHRQELAAIARAMSELKMDRENLEEWQIRNLELDARAAELDRKPNDALTALRRAVALEESVPAAGPVTDILARERVGELLLRQNRAAEALQEFRRVLVIHPRHARALLGAARAATAAGDPAAHAFYAELAEVWAHADADADAPTLAEVGRAVASH